MLVFTLFSSVFFRSDDEGVVFYNTEAFVSKTFKMTTVIRAICDDLVNIDNLNTIPINEKNNSVCVILCNLGFGVIHDENDIVVSFPPSLTIRNDWDNIMSIKAQTRSEVLKYLTDITLFIGGRQDIKDFLYYQTEYPFPGDVYMDYNQLSSFITSVSRRPEIRLKIVFPYIKEYARIKEIINQVSLIKNKYNIIVRDEEYYKNGVAKRLLGDIERNVIVINDTRHLLFDDISDSVYNRFLIFNKEGELAAEDCINRHNLSNYTFIAIYDGTNEEFIKDAVFPTEHELLCGNYTRNHLFSHQAINTFYFGHLFITPDGSVYSDLMEKSIGTIQDDFYSLIINELDNNYSWRRTRETKSYCRRCRFLDICPSISPLERWMNINCIRNS